MIAWGLVPARGGSKSIPKKNLVSLGGRPLLDYGIRAAQASNLFERLVCSTDDDEIAGRAGLLGVEVDQRPLHLAGDDATSADVARDFLERSMLIRGEIPDVLVLIQPTSPFVLPNHFEGILKLFAEDLNVQSAHNATAVTHNNHAWNQRQIGGDGAVTFLFAKERKSASTKQQKPKLLIFGNAIAARGATLLRGDGFYAGPCRAIVIDSPYNFDLDGPEDVPVAEALLASGVVMLSHMQTSGIE